MSEAEVPEVDSPTSSVDPSPPGTSIDEAIAAIKERRRHLEQECRAYLEFTRYLRDIDVKPVDAREASSAVPASFQDFPHDNGTGVDEVTRSYRETVMSLPHIESGRDDSLAVHMAAELGQEVTMVFFQNGQLSPQIHRALVAQAENARRRRSTALESIESEVERLAEFRSEFQSVRNDLTDAVKDLSAATFEDLATRYDHVVEIEAKIEGLLADQQDAIHARQVVVSRYLYAPLEVSYPVLSEGLAVLGVLADVESLVVRYLTARA